MKVCKICKISKDSSCFYKHKRTWDRLETHCKECVKIKSKLNYEKDPRKNYHKIYSNKESFKEYHEQYRKTHKEEISSRSNTWYQNNKERHIKHTTKAKYLRSKVDPGFKISNYIRSRILSALKKQRTNKNNSTKQFLGCDFKYLKQYIESQFKPEMNWSNHGTVWEIDHIKPCASFDLTIIENQFKCFHYSNMQPLFKTTAIAKSFGYIDEIGNRNKGFK